MYPQNSQSTVRAYMQPGRSEHPYSRTIETKKATGKPVAFGEQLYSGLLFIPIDKNKSSSTFADSFPTFDKQIVSV